MFYMLHHRLKIFNTCDLICGIFISIIMVINITYPIHQIKSLNTSSFIGYNISEKIDTYNIAIIRVGFISNGNEIYSFCDNECLKEKMWTGKYSVNNQLLDSSDNRFSIDKQNSIIISVQINKIASNKTEYNVYSKIALEEIQKQYGINIILKYKFRMFIYPILGYDWEGIANLGCLCNYCMSWITIPTDLQCYYDSKKCSNTLISNIMTHELFHNMGLGHSSTDYNNDNVIDDEYGDISDIMGSTNGYYPPKLNFPHLYQLGWLNKINILYDPVNPIVCLTSISYKQSSLKDSEIVGIVINNTIFISYKTEHSNSFDSNLLESDSVYIHKLNGKNAILIKKLSVEDNNMNVGLLHLHYNVMINITDILRI